MKKKILIIDDEQEVRKGFVNVLEAYGFSPVEAANGVMAYRLLKQNNVSAILLDLKLDKENGIDLLKKINDLDYDIPVIIITAHGDISIAVEAMKLGAYDFITKPPDFENLIMSLNKATEIWQLRNKVKQLDFALENSLEGQLGKSPAMKEISEQIALFVQGNFSVILQGETGTGKTFIASIIHNMSKRKNNPFVKVDIGSITETLVESELFGHQKGAFTGANNEKKGFFELANGGTIFIDEIENMSPYIQSKLLRIVEEKNIFRIGSTKPISIDIQIISATNTDIRKNVREKKFREDLLYRLGEYIITIPPLRDRVKDISLLANKFFLDANSEMQKHIKNISKETMDILLEYHWPGNVRELKTVIKKAVLCSTDAQILPKHIEFINNGQTNNKSSDIILFPFKTAVEEIEKQSIKQALIISRYNKSKAAAILDLCYRTLLRKIKEYNLEN